jgi:predicted DNA binding CopG/RHH family protein
MEKVVANMEKGLNNLTEDIREMRRELRQDLHDRVSDRTVTKIKVKEDE